MSTEQKTGWGFQNDNDDSLKSKQGGKFGLNNANITKFEYNGNAGKDESPADAIDITVAIGDKEYRTRIYDITGDLFKGDNKIFSIALASIIAKVIRDKKMITLAKKYSNYHFEIHKGYPTKLHRKLLKKYGPCKIHRKSYKPVRIIIQKSKVKIKNE